MWKRSLGILGVALVIVAGLHAIETPLTPLGNLAVRTDENGYLRMTMGTAGMTDGPLTVFGNLRGRTDGNGYLLVSCPSCSGQSDAPIDATYLTQTANATLTNEQAVGALANGVMRVAHTTGVVTSLGDIGSTTQILFNDGGLFAGNSALTFTKATGVVTINSPSNAAGLWLQQSSGTATKIYAGSGNDFEIDAGAGGSYLYGDGTNWEIGTSLTVDSQFSAQNFTFDRTVSANLGGTLNSSAVITAHDSTAGSAGDLLVGTQFSMTVGTGGIAGLGSSWAVGNTLIVQGAASASNENTAQANVVRADIGTGFTQTGGVAGGYWLADENVYGPIAVRPAHLVGRIINIQQQYNGTPSASPSVGLGIVTYPGIGASPGLHVSATTYPIDVGLSITGQSSSTGVGFTTAIQVGGTATPWLEAASKIGTGITIRDYTTRGLYINNPSGTPTAAIETTTGAVILGDLATTGAATGKTIVCADTAGKLYRSSSGVACAN